MSFYNTLAYSVARSVDVATASVFTRHTDCTISSLCDVALVSGGPPFLQKLGRLLNRISPGHTASARQEDIGMAQNILQYLCPPPSQSS